MAQVRNTVVGKKEGDNRCKGKIEGKSCLESCVQVKDKIDVDLSVLPFSDYIAADPSVYEHFKTKKTEVTVKDVPTEDAGAVPSGSWWSLLLTAFLAGLTALITPCVFPMIPMTVSFFTKQGKGKGTRQAVIFGLSIVFIYT